VTKKKPMTREQSADRSGGTKTTRAPLRRNHAANGTHALRVGPITTNTSAGSVPAGSIAQRWVRSLGVVRNRRPDQRNRPWSSARLT
jgi:hypothetical protein